MRQVYKNMWDNSWSSLKLEGKVLKKLSKKNIVILHI